MRQTDATLALLVMTASLFACGGAADAMRAATVATPLVTPLARCLAYAPGTQFAMSDGTSLQRLSRGSRHSARRKCVRMIVWSARSFM